jgi:UDP:flavonoid glycosyltransferase YjiC (YdhE family)
MKTEELKNEIRQALSDYMYAEGCSCCRNEEKWEEARAKLADLLDVPKYSDGSGFEFNKYREKK